MSKLKRREKPLKKVEEIEVNEPQEIESPAKVITEEVPQSELDPMFRNVAIEQEPPAEELVPRLYTNAGTLNAMAMMAPMIGPPRFTDNVIQQRRALDEWGSKLEKMYNELDSRCQEEF
jgi:hypothetical protein